MSTRTFLTPEGELIEVQCIGKEEVSFMAPATLNKAGELVAGQVVTVPKAVAHNAKDPQEFAAPTPYFTANDKNVSDLRAQVAKAEAALRHAQSRGLSSLQLRRFEDALEAVRRELREAEEPRREQRARETGIGRDDTPTTGNARQVTNAGSFDSWLARFDADMLQKARAKGVFWGPYQPTT